MQNVQALAQAGAAEDSAEASDSKPTHDDATPAPQPVVQQRPCSVFVCSAEQGIELAVRLVGVCSDLRSLLDLIEKCPQRGLVLERGNNSADRPNKGYDGKKDKESLPCAGGQSNCILEGGSAEGGDKSHKEGDGGNPRLLGLHALKVIAKAELETVLSDDDKILVKVEMNRRLLEIIRCEGFGELRLWSNRGVTHCSLLSASQVSSTHPSTPMRRLHES